MAHERHTAVNIISRFLLAISVPVHGCQFAFSAFKATKEYRLIKLINILLGRWSSSTFTVLYNRR